MLLFVVVCCSLFGVVRCLLFVVLLFVACCALFVVLLFVFVCCTLYIVKCWSSFSLIDMFCSLLFVVWRLW